MFTLSIQDMFPTQVLRKRWLSGFCMLLNRLGSEVAVHISSQRLLGEEIYDWSTEVFFARFYSMRTTLTLHFLRHLVTSKTIENDGD